MAEGSLSRLTRGLGAEPSYLQRETGHGSDSGGRHAGSGEGAAVSAVVKKEQRSLGGNSSHVRTRGQVA